LVDKVHFSSDKEDWRTPEWLFKELDEEFNFDLDLFASADNALCDNWMDDAFNTHWESKTAAFGNPPYSKKSPTTWDFVRLAYDWCYEVPHDQRVASVLLVPARTDTKVWHELIFRRAEIRFIDGRLHFSGANSGAPFPSAIVIFDPNSYTNILGPSINARGKK
jgi:site-specific DNA-methyltransferase (adenine-specific)